MGIFRMFYQNIHLLNSYQNSGTANRTIAATNMNATSSRAHTIVCISFEQITSENGSKKRLSSTINFVDLAGSLFNFTSILENAEKTIWI